MREGDPEELRQVEVKAAAAALPHASRTLDNTVCDPRRILCAPLVRICIAGATTAIGGAADAVNREIVARYQRTAIFVESTGTRPAPAAAR